MVKKLRDYSQEKILWIYFSIKKNHPFRVMWKKLWLKQSTKVKVNRCLIRVFSSLVHGFKCHVLSWTDSKIWSCIFNRLWKMNKDIVKLILKHDKLIEVDVVFVVCWALWSLIISFVGCCMWYTSYLHIVNVSLFLLVFVCMCVPMWWLYNVCYTRVQIRIQIILEQLMDKRGEMWWEFYFNILKILRIMYNL